MEGNTQVGKLLIFFSFVVQVQLSILFKRTRLVFHTCNGALPKQAGLGLDLALKPQSADPCTRRTNVFVIWEI